MKFITGILILISMSNVFASEFEDSLYESKIYDDKSYFDVLGERFKDGVKPSLKSIENKYFSGRCFDSNSPDTPTAAAILTKKKKNKVGPIESQSKTFEIKLIGHRDGMAADHWDNFKYGDQLAGNLRFYPINVKTDVLAVDGNGINEYDVEIRSNTNYLVAEFFSKRLRPVQGEENRYEFKKEVQIRCYYFLPELDR